MQASPALDASAAPTGTVGLAALEARVARDLEWLGLPPADWVPPARLPDGTRLYDVVVIGGGMYGIGAAIALRFEGIGNILVVDRAEDGREGPWVTFARMPTLRSPKHLPGPANRIAALTFRAWYEALHGLSAWQALYKVTNGDWQAYLIWLRRTLALPCRHETEVTALRPAADHVRLETTTGPILARRVVLATGRNPDAALIPDFVEPGLRPGLAAHTCDDIDFAALSGRDVIVVGAAASAWDNAATALEAGARVGMYVRRSHLPQVNKGRAPVANSPGMFRGWSALPPEVRWRMGHYAATHPAPPPHETVRRTLAHPGFQIHFGHHPLSAHAAGNRVAVDFDQGRVEADFLILGTGFSSRIEDLPLLAPLAPDILRWRDRYCPPEVLANEGLGAAPWLGAGFELMPAGTRPGLDRLHLFSPLGHLSMGMILTDVPGVNVGAETLARAITTHLATETSAQLCAAIEAFDDHELIGTPFYRASTD